MDFIKENLKLLSIFSPTFGILLAALIVLVGRKWWSNIYHYFQERSKMCEFAKTIPTPPTWPILGNILQLWENDKTPIILTRLAREMKVPTFGIWVGPLLKVIVTDPHDLEIILSSAKSTKKDKIYGLMKPIVDNGLINSEGNYHRAHKKVILPLVTDNRVVRKHAERTNYYARMLIEDLSNHIDGEQFDCFKYVKKCTSALAIATLVDPSRLDETQMNEFFTLTTVGLHILYYRISRPWLHPDFIFKFTKTGRDWYKMCGEANNYVDNIINAMMKEWTPDNETEMTPTGNFLIDNMMRNGVWNTEEIRTELVTLYFGLYDSIEGVLCFLMVALAMHPEWQEKAREEVNKVVQTEEITKEAVSQLDFIEMIVKEGLRLFPVAPLIARVAVEPIKLTTCTIPEGSSLYLLPWSAHRNPEYWENPEEFIPERFNRENSKKRHPYAFLPFSSGYRSCPGSKLGMTSLKIFVAHVVRSFRLETTVKLHDIPLHMHISTRSLIGYPISIKKI